MSREIKFRVWDSVEKELTQWEDIRVFKEDKNLSQCFESFDVYYFEQFTGLKDRNGKEIYEGDILKNSKDLVFRVYRTEGGFAIKQSVWAKDLSDEICTDVLIFQALVDAQTISYIRESCEVIGNIHENKELLK